MKQLVISGGHLITPLDERFADVTLAGGLITRIGPPDLSFGTIIDASGCYVTPGLIDIQVNGGPGCDFWSDPTVAQVRQFAGELAKAGVTTILPTLITGELGHLRKNIEFLSQEIGVGEKQLGGSRAADSVPASPLAAPAGAKAATIGRQVAAPGGQAAPTAGKSGKKLPPAALAVRMPGVHLEGPCLSPQNPGVHPPEHLQPLSVDVLQSIVNDSVRLVTLAPELDSSQTALKFLKERGVVIALGHSNATFDEARQAFDGGISLVTHVFNAMPPIHHRAGGAVTAALLDDRVTCCMICDGKHLAPEAVSLILKAKRPSRVILVTDVARVGTRDGGLSGSSIMLSDAVRNVVNWGVASVKDAFLMASYNPARALKWQDRLGHLAPGKNADIVIWDKVTLAIKHVIVGGELLS